MREDFRLFVLPLSSSNAIRRQVISPITSLNTSSTCIAKSFHDVTKGSLQHRRVQHRRVRFYFLPLRMRQATASQHGQAGHSRVHKPSMPAPQTFGSAGLWCSLRTDHASACDRMTASGRQPSVSLPPVSMHRIEITWSSYSGRSK